MARASPLSRIPRIRFISISVSTILVLSFLASLAALGTALYSRSQTDAQGMAVALKHYALRTIVTGDLLTRIARDAILRRGDLEGISQDAAMARMLAELTDELPEGSGMIVVDASGRMVASNQPLPARPIDLSDRDWFKAHQNGIDLVLSEALLSRVTDRIMFIVTRAVRTPEGRLIAIINFGVPSDYLIGARALPQFDEDVMLTLLNAEGGLLARSTFPEELLGQRFPVPAGGGRAVRFVADRAVDGQAAVEARAADPAYGLIAQASIPVVNVFAPLLWVAAIGLPIILTAVVATLTLLRSLATNHRELTATKTRLEAVLESSHLGSWHYDVTKDRSDMNPRWAEIVGHSATEISSSPQEWASRLHPDEREAVMAALRDVLEGRKDRLQLEHRLRHRDGHWVWVLDSASVVERGADGRPSTLTGTILDISERRETENRVRVLMRELDHRAKNLLAVVYSMINLMKAESVEEFKTAILGRVRALGHVHSLLSNTKWQGVGLDELVRTETAAYQFDHAPRILAQGPPLTLGPSAAQAVAIVVHEWMTNSAKYGALSRPTGSVHLDWSMEGAEGPVRLVWTESGGPEVREPERQGFGTRLLTLMVRDQLNGELKTRWERTGAVFEVSFGTDQLRGG